YTLIYNSRGLRLLQHQTVANVREALRENRDIESVSQTVELQARSCLVRDTDRGAAIMDEIADLHTLLRTYQTGHIKPQ
ncbi:fructose-bisphosphatase class III, partial [Selenomonas noxia]|uniref:fructose-bisphosphatase class III n=1 Tax=Selenomonas noxia TaxID=135083 RepID=UPI0028E442F0